MGSIDNPLKMLLKKTVWYRLHELEKQNARRAEETVELSEEIGKLQALYSDKRALSRLKRELSTSPVIWGDESRLEISDKAAVSSCVFNTNSGRISIGDYTFAGSGVSVLAGSHDPELTGFLRRDSEFREGFDITIGNGVWLGSNSTILGPCVIEDNAVIAAGAVIKPGTHVGKAELYAGIPAHKIRDIMTTENIEEHPHKLAEVTAREEGTLFYSGWREKETVIKDGKIYTGHRMDAGIAVLYTNKDVLDLTLNADCDIECSVCLSVENGRKECIKTGREPVNVKIETCAEGKVVKITIQSEERVLFTEK